MNFVKRDCGFAEQLYYVELLATWQVDLYTKSFSKHPNAAHKAVMCLDYDRLYLRIAKTLSKLMKNNPKNLVRKPPQGALCHPKITLFLGDITQKSGGVTQFTYCPALP